jgi:hypothetical protein
MLVVTVAGPAARRAREGLVHPTGVRVADTCGGVAWPQPASRREPRTDDLDHLASLYEMEWPVIGPGPATELRGRSRTRVVLDDRRCR